MLSMPTSVLYIKEITSWSIPLVGLSSKNNRCTKPTAWVTTWGSHCMVLHLSKVKPSSSKNTTNSWGYSSSKVSLTRVYPQDYTYTNWFKVHALVLKG